MARQIARLKFILEIFKRRPKILIIDKDLEKEKEKQVRLGKIKQLNTSKKHEWEIYCKTKCCQRQTEKSLEKLQIMMSSGYLMRLKSIKRLLKKSFKKQN